MSEYDDSSRFEISSGKAAVRTSVMRKKGSTVIVDNFPSARRIHFREWLSNQGRRAPNLVILVLVAVVAFFLGRMTAGGGVQAAGVDKTAENTAGGTYTDYAMKNDARDASAESARVEADAAAAKGTAPGGAPFDDNPAEIPQTLDQMVETSAVNPAGEAVSEFSLEKKQETAKESTTNVVTAENGTAPAEIAECVSPADASALPEQLHQLAHSGQYTIQVRAYRAGDTNVAGILVGRLRQRKLAPIFSMRDSSGRILVCAGAFDRRSSPDALKMLSAVDAVLERQADGMIRIP